MVYHDRLKRRIFPRSDPPQTSEISEVCVRRNSVPIQRTPIRPVPSAEGIYKCVEAAIAPLRLRGLRVYNYLDDWLIASHSKAAAVQDGHLVVAHLYRLGFVINREKCVLCPRKVTHFLGMILDSTSIEVRLSQERINAIKTCVRQFRLGQSVSSSVSCVLWCTCKRQTSIKTEPFPLDSRGYRVVL